jgi:hypothetical protein
MSPATSTTAPRHAKIGRQETLAEQKEPRTTNGSRPPQLPLEVREKLERVFAKDLAADDYGLASLSSPRST